MSSASFAGADGGLNRNRTTADGLPGPRPATPPDQHSLERAGDFIEHLRTQLAELDRREQNVNAQYAALDQERRRIRLSKQQADDEIARRETELSLREEQLAARQAEVQLLVDEVAAQRGALLHDQEAAAAERARQQQIETEQHENVLRSLAADRCMLEEERAALEEERRQITAEAAEIRVARQALESGRIDFEQHQRQALQDLESQIEAERSLRTSRLEKSLTALEAQILEKRRWWDEEQAQAKLHLEQEREALEQQLAARREEVETQLKESSALHEQHRHEIEQQRIDLEKRTHFHQAHLEQLRRTLEQRQQELDADHQRTRSNHVQNDRQLQLRAAQLHRFREILEHREESLNRSRDLLEASRQSWETLHSHAAATWNQERETWTQETAAQRADMQRQLEILTLHAENLDARRARLDGLRDELEAAHRHTLEIRLAVEQTWAALAQNFGEETSRQRIEQARAALSAHFEDVRTSIERRFDELGEIRDRLEEQRQEFRAERRQFAEWIAERDEILQSRETSVQQEIEASVTRESQWLATRDHWLREKLEAESVIRQLLGELEAGTATSSPYDPYPDERPHDSQPESAASSIDAGYLPDSALPSPAAA
ncbi:MAG: hypothetical protein KF861_10535 [Planctomycetaceae bacterium]|nr:hypothetical protein [Planctomycetaceae bacterium]